MDSVSAARKSGLPVEIVPDGDTGTYNIDAESNGLTELQAGTGSSAGRATPPCIPTSNPALTLMTTVISKRHPNQCTIDAGNRALLRPTDEVMGRAEVKVEKIRALNTEFLRGRMAAGISNWETASNYIRGTWT